MRLYAAVYEFLRRIEILPWDLAASEHYRVARADLKKGSKALSPLDLFLGGHALSLAAVLIFSDKTFRQLSGLRVEDWTG